MYTCISVFVAQYVCTTTPCSPYPGPRQAGGAIRPAPWCPTHRGAEDKTFLYFRKFP